MENRFDELSKALAEGMPRSEALRRVGGLVLGAFATSLGLDRLAWGQSAHCEELCRGLSGSQLRHCRRGCGSCDRQDRAGCLAGRRGALICCRRGRECCVGKLCCGARETCCPSPSGDAHCADLQSDTGNCGKCGTECEEREECCFGSCTHTSSDFANCGRCGRVCDTTEVCIDGNCVEINATCPSPERPDPCVDRATGELRECCQSGLGCCPGEYDGACKDLQNDPRNCGHCGGICPPNRRCHNGQCVCLEGYDLCRSADGNFEVCCGTGLCCQGPNTATCCINRNDTCCPDGFCWWSWPSDQSRCCPCTPNRQTPQRYDVGYKGVCCGVPVGGPYVCGSTWTCPDGTICGDVVQRCRFPT